MNKKSAMITLSHLHPMMVHFPIALVAVGFLADLLNLFTRKEPCLSKIGFYLEILGMAGAMVAWGTGYFLTTTMEGEAGLMRDKHELMATIALVTIIVATIARTILNYIGTEHTKFKYIPLVLYFLAFLFISYTGYLGGTLVMEYMIGL